MHDVFISYSRKDRGFADTVVQHLTNAKFSCWLDTKDLNPAEIWRSELKDAIIDADNLIFVISPDSVDSQYCKMELDFAIEHHKRLIPLHYRPLNANQVLPSSLSERQWMQIDFTDAQATHRLVQVIRNEQKWRNQGTEYLRRAESWRAEKGGVLARVELESARGWLEKGTKMDPGPSELHIRYIQESEAFHLKEAERWKNLYANAVARQLAAQAEVMIGQAGVLLETAALLAVESMRRFPMLAGERALRKALSLLPKRVADMDWANSGDVEHAAFSLDGHHVATYHHDHSVRVWESATGRQVCHITVKDCRKLMFSPTQGCIISCAEHVTGWDPTHGTAQFVLHHEGLADVAYAADGQYIATVGADQSTRIWDTVDHQEFFRYRNSQPMQYVAIAPGAAEVLAWNGSIAEIFRSPGEPPHVLPSEHTVRFAYSPDGQYLSQVSASDYSATLFDVATRAQLLFEDRHWHATFSGNGNYYALGSPEWDAHVYYLPSCWQAGHYFAPSGGGTLERKDVRGRVSCRRGNSVQHDNSVERVALSFEGKYLATTSRDHTARVWETFRGREVLRLLEEVEGPIEGLAFHRDKPFITGWGHKQLRTWEATGFRQAAALLHRDAVWDVCFSGNGELAATVSKDGTCRVWRIPEGDEVAHVDIGSGFGRHTVALSQDGTRVLLDGRRVFERASETFTRITPQIEGDGLCAVSEDWTVIAHVLPDNIVAVLNVATGDELARMQPAPGKVVHLALNLDGSRVALVNEQSGVCIWHWKSGNLVVIAVDDKIRRARYSPSGRQVVLSDHHVEGRAEIWDVDEGRQIQKLQHESTVTDASFDPSEKYVVTTSDDRAARIWQLDTGEQVAQFEHDADVQAARFSPDGTYVLSAGGRSDRTARLWLWRPRDLITEACSRLSRDLTQEEWAQYLVGETYRKTRQLDEEHRDG